MYGKSTSAITQKVVSDFGIISIIKKKIVEKSCPSHFKLGWEKICRRDQCCIGKEVPLVFLTPYIYYVL